MDKFEELKNNQQENAKGKPIEIEVDLDDNQMPQAETIDVSSKSDQETPIEIPVEATNEGVIPAEMMTTREVKPAKKKFYKQKWFWIAVAVLLVVGVFAGGGDEKDKPEDTAVAVEEQSTDSTAADEGQADDTTIADEEQEMEQEALAANAALAGSSNMNISDDLLASTLNSSSDWSGTWKVVSDRHLAFYPEGDIASAFIYAGNYYIQNGYLPEDMKQPFDDMMESMKQLSATISETIGEPCALSVANPANTDNVIITVMDGTVLYSLFDE